MTNVKKKSDLLEKYQACVDATGREGFYDSVKLLLFFSAYKTLQKYKPSVDVTEAVFNRLVEEKEKTQIKTIQELVVHIYKLIQEECDKI